MDRQLLLGKKEVTYGTDPTPAAIDTVMCENIQYQLTGQRVKPNTAKPGVGPQASWVYGEHALVSFEIPLIGSGTAGTAPKWGPIMKACGWAETIVAATSVTYALAADPTAADSYAFRFRDARRSHLILGWRGRVGLKLSAGQRPMLVFTGRGLHQNVADGAALAHADATWTGWKDVRPVAQGTTTFTFNSVAGLGLRELSFEQTDNVKFVDLPEQENVSLKGERAFTGQAAMSTPLPSVLNLESLWKAGTVVQWTMNHNVGGGAGNLVAINGRTQVKDPSYTRVDEDDVARCGLELVPSALSTDDELAIVLT